MVYHLLNTDRRDEDVTGQFLYVWIPMEIEEFL
jgi:hypothetical protein